MTVVFHMANVWLWASLQLSGARAHLRQSVASVVANCPRVVDPSNITIVSNCERYVRVCNIIATIAGLYRQKMTCANNRKENRANSEII